MTKELVINKNTNLNKIENKSEYTKLVIKTKVNPKKLSGFYGVKELVIDHFPKNGTITYNEQNINELSFRKTIEKLTFYNVMSYGMERNLTNSRTLEKFDNLKVIEFSNIMKDVYSWYLHHVVTLEEIIFNVSPSTSFFGHMNIYSPNLKKIKVKYNDVSFDIDLDYELDCITQVSSSPRGNITIKYEGENVVSVIEIDINTNEIRKENIWDDNEEYDYKLIIPDYATDIDSIYNRDLMEISLNLKLLDTIGYNDSLIDVTKSSILEKIVLRSNNEMQLIPEKVIKPKEYGKLKDLYIEDHLLCLEYDKFTLTINSNGNIERIANEIDLIEEVDDTIDLDKYTLEELEEYISYLKLLKLSIDADKEYVDAMKVVRKRVLKKIKK